MSEVLTPTETIAEVKVELELLSANTINRSIEHIQERCGELADVLGNALSRLNEDQK